MFEVQIKSKKLFEELSPYAKEKHKITQVLLLEDGMLSEIPSECLINNLNKIEGTGVSLSFNGTNFVVKNIDFSLRAYFDFYKPWGNEVSLRQIEKIYYLKKFTKIDCDAEYQRYFHKLPKRAKISDLEMSYHRFKINKKIWNLNEFENLYCDELFKEVVAKDRESYSQTIHIISNTEEKDKNGRTFLNVSSSYKNEELDFKVYNSSDVNKKFLQEGEEVNVLLKKRKVDWFLPKDMKINNLETYSPTKETKKKFKVPIDLFRMCYYEYLLRTE